MRLRKNPERLFIVLDKGMENLILRAFAWIAGAGYKNPSAFMELEESFTSNRNMAGENVEDWLTFVCYKGMKPKLAIVAIQGMVYCLDPKRVECWWPKHFEKVRASVNPIRERWQADPDVISTVEELEKAIEAAEGLPKNYL